MRVMSEDDDFFNAMLMLVDIEDELEQYKDII